MYKTIDLFAGAGGITEGFRKAGYKCICANDVDEEAKHTFTFNHPDIPYLLKDIRELTAKEILDMGKCYASDIDVITGGRHARGSAWQDREFQMIREIFYFVNILE